MTVKRSVSVRLLLIGVLSALWALPASASTVVFDEGHGQRFVIAKDGRIAQLVSIWDSAWANGLRIINGQWYTPADPPRRLRCGR